MPDNVKINIDGKILECPIIVGTEGEKAFDIGKLRSQTGYITIDPGFSNTGACKSAITYLDGEKGILRYRGVPIEQLAEKSTFVETSYLLIHGKLPWSVPCLLIILNLLKKTLPKQRSTGSRYNFYPRYAPFARFPTKNLSVSHLSIQGRICSMFLIF